MKIIFKSIKLLSLFLAAAVIVSCSDDDDNNGPSPEPVLDIVQTALATPDLSSLVEALQAADGDLVSILSGSGPFTVLAPTNEAFTSFLSANGFASLEDVPTDVLSQVLLNHVISEDLPASNIVSLGNGYYKTNALGAAGQTMSLFVNTSNGVVFNDGSTVQTADVTASNGIIHIVDKVIDLPNVVDHAEYNPDLSELRSKLADEGLVTALETGGPFTVLAPVNSAFEAFTNPDENLLSQVLLNHVLPEAITSELLFESSERYTSTLAGPPQPSDAPISIYVNTTNGVVFNGVSTVVMPDIVGTNGIVHAVDAVIDIPTVVTFAAANPNFSSLVAALAEADGSDADPMLIPTLSGEGPFTVFAPLNSAFETLLNSNPAWNGVEDIDDSLLNSVLLHHVVSGNVRSGDLVDGISPATLEGDTITINLPGTDGNIADVTDGAGNSDIGIVAVDVQAGNGVIHVLNKVMLPAVE